MTASLSTRAQIGTGARPDATLASAYRHRRWLVFVMAVVLVGLLVAFAAVIRDNEADSHRALSARFEVRAGLTASFADHFVADLANREEVQAGRLLGGPAVSRDAFEQVVAAFDFQAAVLLDGDGNLLQVWPRKPELIGRHIAADYAHLRAAIAGHVGVSKVVPSAAESEPITAVAVPFDTSAGRRVFSGAFSPGGTPLGSYLDSVIPVKGGSAYLLDDSGHVLASSTGARAGADITRARLGVTEHHDGSGSVTTAASKVGDAPWRVVLTVPTDRWLSPLSGQTPSWALWGLMALSGCLALWLSARLGRARADAAAAARTDHLTALPNRRALEATLARSVALAERHHVPLAAAMIDIDRFKAINDSLGHDGGDRVLQATAAALASATRAGDFAGRWGGEEFLVLLPHTDLAAAVEVAERIRELVESTISADHRSVTVSVGVADLHDADSGALISQADSALYAAKTAGRNRVEAYRPAPPQATAGLHLAPIV